MLVNDREAARDIVQEAFLRLWQSPRTPRERDGFKGWLYRTVTNLAHDHGRRVKRSQRLRFWEQPPQDPEKESLRRWSSSIVDDALLTLSRKERAVVYLRFFEDVPHEEVARMLGIRTGACRVILHRALKKLRNRIDIDAAAEAGQP